MKLHRTYRHRRKRKSRIRQKCGDCELRFHSKFCMLLHSKFHRRTSQGWFHCDVCKKRFQKLANFIKHRNRHPTRERSKVSKPLTLKNDIIESQSNFKDESVSMNDAEDSFPSNDAVNEQQHVPQNFHQIKGETDNETEKVSAALKFIEQLRALLKLNRGTDEEFDDFKDGSLQDSKVSSSSNTADDALPDAMLSSSTEPTNQCLLGIENSKDKTSHLIGSHVGKDSVIISKLNDSHLQLDQKGEAEMRLNNTSPEKFKTHSAVKPTVSAEASKEEAIPKRIYTCSTCKASFISYSKLRRHKRILHKTAHNLSNSVSGKARSTVDKQQSSFTASSHNHQCTFCLQKLSSFNSLARHMREVHKCKQKVAKNVLQCQKSCDGIMFSGQDVTELATNCIKPSFFGSRDGEGLLKCSLCDASFLTFIGQKRHLQFKHNIGFDAKVKKYSSKKDFTSKQESSYVDDKLPKSKMAEKGYETDENITCKKCESNFDSVRERRLHALKSHGLEVSFEGEKFMFLELQIKSVEKSSNNAQRRPLLDNSEKFYRKADNSCKLCFAKYKSFNSLQKHMFRKHKVKIYRQFNLLRWNKRTCLSTDSKKSMVCLKGKNQIIAKRSLDKKEKKSLDKNPNDSMDDTGIPLLKSPIKRKKAIEYGEGNDNQEISNDIEKSTTQKQEASKTQADIVANKGLCGDIFEGTTSKDDPLWRVDFQRKKFSCKICDASFSGYFIQKKHMLMTHGIHLDAQGRRVEQDSKTVHSIDKSTSKPDRNASLSNTENENAPSSSSLFHSDTMQSGNLNTEEDNPYLSPATTMNMTYVRNSNGKFDCPHCLKEFGNLIDRHIHVIDNHGRIKEKQADRQSNLDEHAEPNVAINRNESDVDSQTKKFAPVKSRESSTTLNDKPKTDNKTGSGNIKKPRGTGEFKCPLCEKRYAHKKGRMRHMKTAHVSSSASSNSNVAAEGDLSSAEDQRNEKQHEDSTDVQFRQIFSESKVISNLRAITVLDSDMEDNSCSDGVTEDGINNDEGKTKRCFSPVPPCEENDLLEKNVFSQLNASLRLQEFGLHSAYTKDKTGNPKENDPSFEDSNRFDEDMRKDDQMSRYEMKFDRSDRHVQGSKPNSNLDVITVDTTEDEDDVIDIINLDDTNFDGIEPEENNEQEAAYMASDFESSELKCSGSDAEQSNIDDVQQQILSSSHITGYMCSIPGCSKSFSSKRSYQRHYRDTCKLCHKKMKCRSSVKRHLLEVHKITNVLTCDMCSEFFPEPISLAFHNKEMHISEISIENF